MSEPNPFDNAEKPPVSPTQETLRSDMDSVLDEYFLLLSRKGLDKDQVNLDEEIQNKRKVLIELSQELNGQEELDHAFSEKVDAQLDRAEKGIDTGKQELKTREDGKDNVEAIIADMEEYAEQFRRVDGVLDTIKDTLESKDPEKDEVEALIFELKTMIKSFMNIGAEIQKLFLALEVNNKRELNQRFTTIVNGVVSAIKNFDETDRDKNKLDKMKKHFYTHFDEALHLYEELRDLTK
jgi:hypothetical protein